MARIRYLLRRPSGEQSLEALAPTTAALLRDVKEKADAQNHLVVGTVVERLRKLHVKPYMDATVPGYYVQRVKLVQRLNERFMDDRWWSQASRNNYEAAKRDLTALKARVKRVRYLMPVSYWLP